MEGKGTQTGYLTDRSNRGEIRILHTESYSIQYRLILMTENSPVLSTPILYDVELEWVPYTYIEEEGSYLDFELVGALPNPSSRESIVYFRMPVEAMVEIALYDISGRMVSCTFSDYASGTHQINIGDLTSGVYIVRMNSGEFTSSKLFTVLS